MHTLKRKWQQANTWRNENPVYVLIGGMLVIAVVGFVVAMAGAIYQHERERRAVPPETVVCELAQDIYEVAQDIYELVEAQNSAQNDEAVTRRLDEVDTSINRYCTQLESRPPVYR